MEKLERINKYLSESGVCSRREVDELIETGRVEVNQQPARIGMLIDTERDKVYVDGQRVDPEHPEKNAIHPEVNADANKPWWQIRNEKREANETRLRMNPKSKLLRQGSKQKTKQASNKRDKAQTATAEALKKLAQRSENRQAKSFSEALSDKQKLMNVKTRRVENAVNPKAASLRGKKTARPKRRR